MTEITVDHEEPENVIVAAFAAALILAPLAPALPFAAVLLPLAYFNASAGGATIVLAIPVFAVGFGAVPYLLFGTPFFVRALRNREPTLIAGVKANLLATLVIPVIGIAVAGPGDALGSAAMLLTWGTIFAAIWGAIFGMLYTNFAARPLFNRKLQ